MKKRKDCVFGMHFDFHANLDQENLGEDFRLEDYELMLDRVKPDVIQVDTKGHPGVTSYPSKLNNHAKNIKKDMLKEIRRITKERGVLLFSHYSGVWDMYQCNTHPEYKAKFDNIEFRGETSVFSSYSEDLLIPQLEELAGDYGIDGVWIDGECWATQVDISETAINKYIETYGEQPDLINNRKKYENFCRNGFYNYVKNYVSKVHKDYPNFEIASNWLCTTFCPHNNDFGVDFITGDYDPYDSVNTARFQSRSLLRKDIHWELLSWGFNIQNGYFADKGANQIKQEIANIYNAGGFASLYYTALRNNIKINQIDVWENVSKFAKELAEKNKGIIPCKDIAVYQSEKGFYNNKKRLFSTWEDEFADDLRGVTLSLSDLGYHTEVVNYHELLNHVNNYNLIVIPNFGDIEEDVFNEILKWINLGGKLICSGYNNVEYLKNKVNISNSIKNNDTIFIYNNNDRIGISGEKLLFSDGALPTYSNYLDGELLGKSLTNIKYGKGDIVVTGFPFGKFYLNNKGNSFLRLIDGVLHEIEYKPIFKVDGFNKVDMIPSVKNGHLQFGLVNLLGSHADINFRDDDFIPPLNNVKIKILKDFLVKNNLLFTQASIGEKKLVVSDLGEYIEISNINIIINVIIEVI